MSSARSLVSRIVQRDVLWFLFQSTIIRLSGRIARFSSYLERERRDAILFESRRSNPAASDLISTSQGENRLLVASVYAGTERNAQWIRLQQHFLAKTTTAFQHLVYLNDHVDEKLFPPTTQILADSGVSDRLSHLGSHGRGLEEIVAFFKRSAYTQLLILDSDAFPIMPNWIETLTKQMHALMPSCAVAAAIRCENLDDFPHPSILFIGDKAQDLDFSYGRALNRVGKQCRDVGQNLKIPVFPLLRSNAFNPHPVLGAVYYDLFYHHGCGSRRLQMRSDDYYAPMIGKDCTAIENTMFQMLVDDPDAYIAKLCERAIPAQTRLQVA